MPHPRATDVTEARVRRLTGALFAAVDDGNLTVAQLAEAAGLKHETVRRLRVNPAQRNRYGPGFFIVAAIAQAQGLSLDEIATEPEGT